MFQGLLGVARRRDNGPDRGVAQVGGKHRYLIGLRFRGLARGDEILPDSRSMVFGEYDRGPESFANGLRTTGSRIRYRRHGFVKLDDDFVLGGDYLHEI